MFRIQSRKAPRNLTWPHARDWCAAFEHTLTRVEAGYAVNFKGAHESAAEIVQSLESAVSTAARRHNARLAALIAARS